MLPPETEPVWKPAGRVQHRGTVGLSARLVDSVISGMVTVWLVARRVKVTRQKRKHISMAGGEECLLLLQCPPRRARKEEC